MRTHRDVVAETQGASVIGQGPFQLASDSFGAPSLSGVWVSGFAPLPDTHTGLKCSSPGLHGVRRHSNAAEWMGLLQNPPNSSVNRSEPMRGLVAGFQPQPAGAECSEGKARRPGRWLWLS